MIFSTVIRWLRDRPRETVGGYPSSTRTVDQLRPPPVGPPPGSPEEARLRPELVLLEKERLARVALDAIYAHSVLNGVDLHSALRLTRVPESLAEAGIELSYTRGYPALDGRYRWTVTASYRLDETTHVLVAYEGEIA